MRPTTATPRRSAHSRAQQAAALGSRRSDRSRRPCRRRESPDGCSTCGRPALVLPRRFGDRLDRPARCSASPRRCDREAGAIRASACAASTVPAQVRKSLAVKSSPLTSRRYAFTSSEPIVCRCAVRSSTYWNSSYPGRSRQALTIRASRASCRSMACSMPLLPRNSKRTAAPQIARVAIAHRRQADRPVGARVFLVADADQRLLEELHDRREHLVARKPAPCEVGGGAPADPRQRLGKRRPSRPYFTSSRTWRQRG